MVRPMSTNPKSEIPRGLLVQEVRRIANILIRVPSMDEYDSYAKLGRAVTCAKKFGGWTNFLIAAGLDPHASRRTYSTDELRNEFKRVADIVGRTPKYEDYDKLGQVGRAGTIAIRFGHGKWANACAALGYLPPEHDPVPRIGGWNKGMNRVTVNTDKLKYLYETEGLSISSIAEIMQISRGTVRRRMDEAGIHVRRHHYMQPLQTEPETILYKELERQLIPFMRQQPIDGLYVVDALVPGAKIVIECDGDYWHRPEDTKIALRDQKKTKYLESRGYQVFRFWESDIKKDVVKCVNQISNLWKRYKNR